MRVVSADIDADETEEWLESFDDLLARSGPARARLMLRLLERAGEQRVAIPALTSTDYVNTIPTELEPWFPGDEESSGAIAAGSGGTRRSWCTARSAPASASAGTSPPTPRRRRCTRSASTTRFFRASTIRGRRPDLHPGPRLPGIYARAFLEGPARPPTSSTASARAQPSRRRLPSYPHPRLMPDFWEFPTVSMGLGPMNAIYQARFNHYLHDRGIKDTSDQHVWAFLGDGEWTSRKPRAGSCRWPPGGLDNLTFVVNCNLQRLDGPVRGNGKIIQELGVVLPRRGLERHQGRLGPRGDPLLHADKRRRAGQPDEPPDGDYQTYKANDGAFIRDHFFGKRSAHQGDGRESMTDDI